MFVKIFSQIFTKEFYEVPKKTEKDSEGIDIVVVIIRLNNPLMKEIDTSATVKSMNTSKVIWTSWFKVG